MRTARICVLLAFATLVSASILRAEEPKLQARVQPAKPRNVLIFTYAAGFRHGSIMTGAESVALMGRETGAYNAEIMNNPAVFTKKDLARYDALLLSNTTGDWLNPKGEKVDADTLAERRAAVLDFVNGGKGLVGWHSASDSQYQWTAFGKMLGGYFDGHPWHQKIRVKLEEPKHPLLACFDGKGFEITDEIYQFKAPYSRDNLRILLTVDNESIDANRGKRADKDFAIAWIRSQGKGRVFYSSLGHREEIFRNRAVMQFYLDGIQFACGDLKADATPSAQLTQLK